MICATCGKETDTVFEVQGYLGTYDECEECFGGDEEDDDADGLDTGQDVATDSRCSPISQGG